MKILKDGFRADMERIKRELTTLRGVSIHVGILGRSAQVTMAGAPNPVVPWLFELDVEKQNGLIIKRRSGM